MGSRRRYISSIVLQAIGDLKALATTYEASLTEYAIHPEGKRQRRTISRRRLHSSVACSWRSVNLEGARAKYEASLEMQYAIHPEGKKAKTIKIAASLAQLGSVLKAIGNLKSARAVRRRWRCSTRSIPRERRQRRTRSRRRYKTSAIVLQAIGDLKALAQSTSVAEMEYAIHPEGKKAKTNGIAMTLTRPTAVARSLRDFYFPRILSVHLRYQIYFSMLSMFSLCRFSPRAGPTAHLDAGSSYETILAFTTDRHRRLMSGQARSNQFASTIAQALAQWESDIAYVRRTEKDIRGKHRRSVKLRAGRASAARKQAARVASSAAKFAKRLADKILKQDTKKKKKKKKTKKKKKKKRK